MGIVVERISERGMPPWVRYQHTTRYEWAGGFSAGKKVVDAACGTGYGVPILLGAGAAAVEAFDISNEAIDEARRRYPQPGASFAQADVTALPARDDSYELAVSFETIEHVEDDEGLVAELARVLAPGGVFLCSTPNREVMNPGRSIDEGSFNRHHVREYTPPEFREILERHFSHVEIYGQTFFSDSYCRALLKLAGVHLELGVKAHQARKLAGIFFEKPEKHRPTDLKSGFHAEALVAVCRLQNREEP